MSDGSGASRSRIVELVVDESTVARRTPEVAHERAVAIHDLIDDNWFEPVGCGEGPYRLKLRMEDDRLVFEIGDEAGAALGRVPLSIAPFRKVVKDYFMVCESYYAAIRTAPPSRIEAIDMGRRGLHDEGSALLRDRLAGRIDIDHATARRLFTLFCVLQIRG